MFEAWNVAKGQSSRGPNTFARHCICILLDRKYFDVSKTVSMMSVSITELVRQAKTWEKSNLEVGHLTFVIFQSLAYRVHIEIWMSLHFLGLPLDVNHLLKLEWGFYYKEGAHETCLRQWAGKVTRSHDVRSRQSYLAFLCFFWRQRNFPVGTLFMFYVKNILTIDSIHRLTSF